jgi:phage tail protein X
MIDTKAYKVWALIDAIERAIYVAFYGLAAVNLKIGFKPSMKQSF